MKSGFNAITYRWATPTTIERRYYRVGREPEVAILTDVWRGLNDDEVAELDDWQSDYQHPPQWIIDAFNAQSEK